MKKRFGIMGIALISLMSSNVHATLGDSLKNGMRFVFFDLSKVTESNVLGVMVLKFLIWILAFAIVFFGVKKLFKEKSWQKIDEKHSKIAVMISIVISLLGTLLIPNKWIITIFETYSTLIGIMLAIAPAIGGIAINLQVLKDPKKGESESITPRLRHFLKALIYFMIFYVYGTLVLSALAKINTPTYNTLYQLAVLGLTFVFALMILELFFSIDSNNETSKKETKKNKDNYEVEEHKENTRRHRQEEVESQVENAHEELSEAEKELLSSLEELNE